MQGIVIPAKLLFSFNSSVLVLTAVTGITRGATLTADPYLVYGNANVVAWNVFFGLGYPLMNGAFALLLLTLYELVVNIEAFSKYYKFLGITKNLFITIASAEFVVTFITDMMRSYDVLSRTVELICVLYFIVWGIFLATGFLYYRNKLSKLASLQKNAARKQEAVNRLLNSSVLASILSLALSFVSLYGVISEVYKKFDRPTAWYAYQTSVRFLELGMAGIILNIVIRAEKSKWTASKIAKEVEVRSRGRTMSQDALLNSPGPKIPLANNFNNATGKDRKITPLVE